MEAETQLWSDVAPIPESCGVLLQALNRTLEEVRARSPEYFEQHALRTTRPGSEALAELIGDAFDVEILFSADPSSLSAVDRLFESRLGEERLFLEAADLEEFAARFASWTRQQAAARRAERERLAGFPGPDTLRSLGELQYHSFGDRGPTVVIVNAIGMGLEYWDRLIDRLSPDHRVVIWKLRTAGNLDDQVADVAAIVEEVAQGPVHLVGWCSGPKVCLRYAAAHPERVASMVFLSGTYGDPSTETDYQKRLGKVFELLERSPGMAKAVRGILTDSTAVAAGLSEQAGDFAQDPEVLARADPSLHSALVAPYRSDESILAYVKQIRDFWSRSLDAGVSAPTLVVGAELDRVALSRLGLEFAQSLPRGRFVEMPGATHYCMYDRPDEVADLIRDFLAGG